VKTIKVYFDKNLKMSDKKLASQCSHAVGGLVNKIGYDSNTRIIVLETRTNRLNELYQNCTQPKYLQKDLGFTEVEKGSLTAFAYLESEE